MGPEAFFKLNYGVYVVSNSADGKDGGCAINIMAQVTSSSVRLSITLNKSNCILKLIGTSGTFSGAVPSENVEMKRIKRFSFQSGKNADKYDGVPQGCDSLGNPYSIRGVCVRFACRMISTLGVGTHVIAIGEAVGVEAMDSASPLLTYVNYHVKKSETTLPSAPPYQENTEGTVGYRCTTCGYTLEPGTLPDNFICPVRGKGASYLAKL